MKRIVILFGLVFSLAVSRADLVLKQNIQSAMVNGTITTQIKGNKIRMDMPPSPQGTISTIMDLNSGDSVTLLRQQKIAMKVPGAELKQMAENMKQARTGAGANAPPPEFHDTGKTGKVDDYDAEIYTWSGSNGASQTVWIAKNYPNYNQIKVEMDKLNNSPVAQISKGTVPDVSTLPGMPVKTQMEVNGQEVTSTLVSAKQEPVDASIFEIPKDYQEMTQPSPGMPPKQ